MKILVILSFVVWMLSTGVTVMALAQDKCVFPFDYEGRTYNSCTYADHYSPWCAWDRHYQEDRWSNCDCSSSEEQRLNCPAHMICLPAAEGHPAQCYHGVPYRLG